MPLCEVNVFSACLLCLNPQADNLVCKKKKDLNNFPKLKMLSTDLSNSPEHKYIQLTVSKYQEKRQIFAFVKLQPVNFGGISVWKKDLNDQK